MCGGNSLHRKFWWIFQWLESIFTLPGLALYDISTKQIKISVKKPGKAFGKLLQPKWPTSYFIDNFLCYISDLRGLEPTDRPGTPIPQPGGRLCCRGFHTTGVAIIFAALWNALASDLRHSAFSSLLLSLAIKKYSLYISIWVCNIFRWCVISIKDSAYIRCYYVLVERSPAKKMYFWLAHRADTTTPNFMSSVDIRCTQKLQPTALPSIHIQHNLWNI